jgi:hypothetical protein
MATTAHYHYELYENGTPFNPGTSRSYYFGPFAWGRAAVTAMAHPFDATGQNRSLSVTSVRRRTTPSEYLEVTVSNTGPDPAYIWYVELGVINP